jgi:hypothetical protein
VVQAHHNLQDRLEEDSRPAAVDNRPAEEVAVRTAAEEALRIVAEEVLRTAAVVVHRIVAVVDLHNLALHLELRSLAAVDVSRPFHLYGRRKNRWHLEGASQAVSVLVNTY